MKIADKLALARKQVASWQKRREDAIRTLVKAEAKLPVLTRAVQRLERRGLAQDLLKRAAAAPAEKPIAPEVLQELTREDDGIPTVLRRTPEAAAAEAFKAEADWRKRQKAIARIETMKAKKRGDTKRMPLSGKEAVAAIRQSG